MGKDRQEKKLKESKRVESDRDQSLGHKGATRMESPEEARKGIAKLSRTKEASQLFQLRCFFCGIHLAYAEQFMPL